MTTLFQLIAADPTCTTLLGNAPVKFFEFATAPQLETVPYATWQELAATPFNLVEGVPGTDHVKYQIDTWAATAAEVRTITRAIRRAIDGVGVVTYVQNTWDEESRLYRSVIHYHKAQEV